MSYKESKTSDHESLFSRSCDDGKVVTLKIEFMKQHPMLLSDKKIEFDISVSVVLTAATVQITRYLGVFLMFCRAGSHMTSRKGGRSMFCSLALPPKAACLEYSVLKGPSGLLWLCLARQVLTYWIENTTSVSTFKFVQTKWHWIANDYLNSFDLFSLHSCLFTFEKFRKMGAEFEFSFLTLVSALN